MKIHEAFRYVVVVKRTNRATKYMVRLATGRAITYKKLASVSFGDMYKNESSALIHVFTINSYNGEDVASILAVPVDEGTSLGIILGALKKL